MVILSVSVTNEKGKILIARQYVPMTRLRIEGLLAAFPKLIASEEHGHARQHTFIETDEVRYVYQPINALYLLLITNMQSNILEDLSTLRMIAKLIPQYCHGHDETSIQQHAFDLVFAIDETISPMGYREQVDEKQIEQFIAMDSQEEKLTKIIEDSKQQHQREFVKKKESELDKLRNEQLRLQKQQQGKLGGIPGIPINLGGLGFGSSGPTSISSDSNQALFNEPKTTIISHGSNNNNNNDEEDDNKNSYSSSKTKTAPRKTGLNLGSKSKKDDALLTEAMEQDKKQLKNNLLLSSLNNATNIGGNDANEDTSGLKPVEVYITEKLSLQLGRDGDLKKFEIKGDMEVVINIPEATKCVIETVCNYNEKDSKFGRITWRLHPRMDSNLWNKGSGKLVLKDEDKSFQIGRVHKTSILKWRLNVNDTNDESIIPIHFEFWPENDHKNHKVQVSARYRIQEELVSPLSNVIISFPMPKNNAQEPNVNQCDGNYNYSKQNHELQWILENINPNDEGTFDYKINDCDIDELWPVSMHFEMKTSYSQLQVKKVTNGQTSEEFEFASHTICVTDQCAIQNS